ncbi:M16 family metallopeptidase, partial [Treponema sp. R6D11]
SDAMDRVRKKILPILFAGSAYAERQPIGLAEIIENATSENVKEFYNRWYTSDNMAIVFAGDFDGKALESQLAQHFTMPVSSKPVNRPLHELPPPKNGNFNVNIITDPELTSTNFYVYYKMNKGPQRGTLASYRESVIDFLIDYMLSLRFEEAHSDPQSATNGSWGGIWRWSANSKFYSMGTEPKTGRVEDALRELLLEKEAVRRFGFTESGLRLSKNRLYFFR